MKSIYCFVLSLAVLSQSANALNKDKLLQKLSEPVPEWMEKQIQQSLEPFTSELTIEHLDDLSKMKFARYSICRTQEAGLNLSRVQIREGQFFSCSEIPVKTDPSTIALVGAIRRLHNMVHLPDLDLVICGKNQLDTTEKLEPIFVERKTQDQKGLILMPDYFSLLRFERETFPSVEVGKNKMEPIEVVQKFKGQSSEISYVTLGTLQTIFPEVPTKEGQEQLEAEEVVQPEPYDVFIADEMTYPYVIDLEDKIMTHSLLRPNALVFKKKHADQYWISQFLKPYEHYIPVQKDLSDLAEQLEWVQEYPQECQSIAENARVFAQEMLNEETVYQYLYWLLKAYAEKQKQYY